MNHRMGNPASAAHSWESGSARMLWPELTFSLVLTRRTLPEIPALGKHDVYSGEPSSMARICTAVKRGQIARTQADVPISGTHMRDHGALVHIRGKGCNRAATGCNSLANALTRRLSQ